jgi:galactose mutarotase-like enzyme
MMTMIKIKNDRIQVSISTLGAEIQEVTSVKDRFDYIWNDVTGEYWNRHAPILFPIIGRLNDNTYFYHGNQYELSQHGFLRDQEFSIVMKDVNFVKLQSSANDKTQIEYPFNYRFTVTYQLVDNQLKIQYEIENLDAKTMYYSLGLHPGFTVESDLENYHLVFEPHADEIKELRVDPAPFLNGVSKIYSLQNGTLPLSHAKLDNGLVIYSVDNFTNVQLVNTQSSHSVQLDISAFPYLAVWSPEHRNAPFVCVEPFKGLPDVYGKPGKLQDKLGENSVLVSETDMIKTSIRVY